MKIFLVRHGQSYGNLIGKKTGIIKGRRDNSSLTPKGKNQIELIAQRFFRNKIKIDEIFASPLKRTIQTSDIFKKYYPQVKINNDPRLLDLDFGHLEGIKWQEAKEKYSQWFNQFINNRLKTSFPGGESIEDLQNRIKNFIQDKLKEEKNYLIITHEGVIRGFLAYFSKNNLFFWNREKIKSIDNGTVSSLYLKKNKKLIYQINEKEPLNLGEDLLLLIVDFLKEQNFEPLFLKKNFSYSDNLVFTIEEQCVEGKKILKIVPLYKKNSLKKECYLCQIFRRLNLPTPLCLKMKKSKNFYLYLREYINKPLGKTFLNDKNLKNLVAFSSGKFLKEIHRKTSFLKMDKAFSMNAKIYNQETWRKEFLDSWIKNDLITLKSINISSENYQKLRYIFEKFEGLIDNISEGLIYYDFHLDNFTVNYKDNQLILTGLWDFENSFWGDPRFDLAYTIKLSFFKNKILINQFLKGYYQNKINKLDKKIIFFYLLIICTGSITYKKERGLNYYEEISNLKYYLKNYFQLLR